MSVAVILCGGPHDGEMIALPSLGPHEVYMRLAEGPFDPGVAKTFRYWPAYEPDGVTLRRNADGLVIYQCHQ